MKRAKIASVADIAERLDRNRQRVNSWMREKQIKREPESSDQHADEWEPEAHVPY
jgi:hypothetical protein